MSLVQQQNMVVVNQYYLN